MAFETRKANKAKAMFVCAHCGYTTPRWMGRCPECQEWESFEERNIIPEERNPTEPIRSFDPEPLSSVRTDEGARISSGFEEFNRILGGGFVPGSLVLLGGEPGIGKSTILLQSLMKMASLGLKVLYASGEESLQQISSRAKRLGKCPPELWSIAETRTEVLVETVKRLKPDFIAVDSIQTMITGGISSSAGSVSQIREATTCLTRIARELSAPVIIVGHVTKDGVIAGPRALEHLVDTVLYFEGDRSHTFRLLRTVKNRFGPTFETGVFEMTDQGLKEVNNPSALFMGNRSGSTSGSVTVPCLEGSRPILVEIQALVTQSYLAMPRRTASGIDSNRLALLIAIAEKHLQQPLYDKDIFVNATGGLKITEPAADIGITAAIISSLLETPVMPETALFGETGLTGEIRAVSRSDLRVSEARRLGFKHCITPPERHKKHEPEGINIIRVSSVKEAINEAFQKEIF